MIILNNVVNLNESNKRSLIADKKISMAILSPFVVLMIQYFILYFGGLNETGLGSAIQFSSKVIVGIVFLYTFHIVFKRSGIMLVLVYSFAIIIFAYTYMYFELNRPHLLEISFKFFFISLPCFMFTYSIVDFQEFEHTTKKASYLIYLLGVALGILVLAKRISIGTYSMTMSYYMLLPTITFLKELFDRYSLKHLLLSTISIFLMLAIGSRGAIMCLAVYILLYHMINFRKGNFGKVVLNILFMFVIIIGFIYLKDILMVINSVLNEYGIYSRSINLFLRDEVHLSGRQILYEEIIGLIFLNPLIGIGISGDRAYLGGYTHNIFLEILSGFGVIFGALIIILLAFIIFRSLSGKDKYKSNLSLVWLCIGLVPLAVSGSYLTDFQFWIFLGLAIRKNSNVKTNALLQKTKY